jgi:manganese/zinc/iron transport system permease protein
MEIFLDPLYRGPFIGTLLMSFSMALIGALMFVRKQSLIGETVSHATFPGVACGALIASCLVPTSDGVLFWAIMIGALLLGILGCFIVEKITLASKKSDVSLCYTLASFFGAGVLIASYMQQTSPLLYKKIQVFFYGQVATMTDWHIAVYGALSFLILGCVFFLFRAFTYSCFDPLFSKSVGINLKKMNNILLLLLVLAIVIGIRSVGIVLISGMLIAPSVAARVWTRRFSAFTLLSSCFGIVAALLGSYFSLQEFTFAQGRYIPPGPATVVIASLIAFSSLLFSPSKGLCAQMLRKYSFQKRCLEENILKCLWRAKQKQLLFSTLLEKRFSTKLFVWFATHRLYREGFVKRQHGHIILTAEGIKKAAYIVRLHRLWELYLMEFLATGIENVHRSAEEIEHLITPDLEVKLTKVLSNPNQDPHQQPIPPKELL